MIYNWVRPPLCTIFYSETPLLRKLDLWCSLGGICTTATRNRPRSENFVFCNFSYFLVVCIHMLLHRLSVIGIFAIINIFVYGKVTKIMFVAIKNNSLVVRKRRLSSLK
jgi:hypothetical protein